MIRIAHRGNLTGPSPQENDPEHVAKALRGGFHVEVDAWLVGSDWFLGHDAPTYPVDMFFFRDARIWTHCKNVEALLALSHLPDANCFYQEGDKAALTSRGHVWTHSACMSYGSRSIAVCLGDDFFQRSPGIAPYGICSDFAASYPGDAPGLPFKVLVCDVDGVMCADKLYDLDGNVCGKSYCDMDFTAIKRFKAAGIQVCFLSGDKRVNEVMASTRKIDFFHNPIEKDKVGVLPFLEANYGVSRAEMAYVGDDYYDIGFLSAVGTSFCPRTAPGVVKRVVTRIIPVDGGKGVLAGLYDLVEDRIPHVFPRDSRHINP